MITRHPHPPSMMSAASFSVQQRHAAAHGHAQPAGGAGGGTLLLLLLLLLRMVVLVLESARLHHQGHQQALRPHHQLSLPLLLKVVWLLAARMVLVLGVPARLPLLLVLQLATGRQGCRL